MKKLAKRFVSAACALTMLLVSAASASAYSGDNLPATVGVSADISRISSKELISAYSQEDNGGYDQALLDKLTEGIANFDESIDISSFNILKDDLKSLMDYIFYENPELVQYRGAYRYYYSDIVTRVLPTYVFTKDESDKYITPLNAEIEKVVANAEKYSDDFQKLLYVHDYLATNCEYATEVLEPGADVSDFVFTSYGCLVDRRAVCQGYSMAYKAILKRLSIPCGFASSDKMNHIWNVVTIDGKSYHTDVTFDDPTSDLQGRVEHSSFLCTDKEIAAADHEEWTTNIKISDVSYTGRFWDNVSSRIIISGDEMIYAVYDDANRKSHLEKRDYSTWQASTVPSALDGVRWRPVGDGNRYFTDNYSRLELVGDKIYYSLPDGINSIGIDGGNDERIYTLSDTSRGYIYGFFCDGEKFYGELRESPSAAGTILELPIQYPETLKLGDVDGDGKIALSDAIMVQKSIVKILTLDAEQFKAADVDRSGALSVADAILIQKCVVGITSLAA